uniref:Uncharacterized protein n=1 Tax=Tanacetum cinerariifolium TaxID=118510 RepID=A0A699Q872_TANCI|nr:hypothetical protein [Tanacetum cinerariifolium]
MLIRISFHVLYGRGALQITRSQVNLGIDTRPLEVDRISHQSLAVGNGSLPTGAPQGEELCLIKPLLDSSFSCSDKSFIPKGASR